MYVHKMKVFRMYMYPSTSITGLNINPNAYFFDEIDRATKKRDGRQNVSVYVCTWAFKSEQDKQKSHAVERKLTYMCLCVIYVRCIFLLSFWTGVLIEKQSDRKRCCRDRGTAKPWHQNHEAIFGIAHKWQTVKKYIIIFKKKEELTNILKRFPQPRTFFFF